MTLLKISGWSKMVMIISAAVMFSAATLTYTPIPLHLKPEKLIAKMEEALGGKERFYNMLDVQFDYVFEYVESGKKDISEERMIFEGEQTWARYTTHSAIVSPDVEGEVIHTLINHQPYVFIDGQQVDDERSLKSCASIRKANYYWFTMMYKLSDPGVLLSAEGHEKIGDVLYHKVKVSYDPDEVGKEDNDTYLLYLNSATHLVDQFHFAMPEDGSYMGVKVEVEYDTVNGLKVPAKRSAYMPDENGKYSTQPRLIQTSTNFRFNNGFNVKGWTIDQK
ncbi:DUF6503 family protein [Portibacter marinus]|uniref:DUF6503 family protein n=1 Tax=Portibacter marinus TaxID=2898660 RepID=UPI001F3E2C5E|nr:DUF6503 family protein [Portibacter marinus]